jgi:Domain of unknown function (DUF4476)
MRHAIEKIFKRFNLRLQSRFGKDIFINLYRSGNMIFSKFLSVTILSAVLLVSACGKVTFGKKDHSSPAGPPAPAPFSNPLGLTWDAVPSSYHPDVIHENFVTDSVEAINLDSFWFGSDVGVEVLYKQTIEKNAGNLDLYTVGTGGFGSPAPQVKDKTLMLERNGRYECQIQTHNGAITELKGGCFIFAKVILPVGSEIEVYHEGKLITRRFRPMTMVIFLEHIERARFDSEKLEAIDEFNQSFADSSKAVTITTSDLEKVLRMISFDDAKLDGLRKLQAAASDRAALPAMIDRVFTFTGNKEKARQICGI